jgi:hypothetical protein
MKAQKISTRWIEGMAFEAEVNGHKIILDADDKVDGKDLGQDQNLSLKLLLLVVLQWM